MAGKYTIKHIDDFEHPYPKWLLARKSLGVSSFGLNVCELQPGEQIPEHDETGRGHEEVFVTLSGSPSMVIDGAEHPAPAGTCVRRSTRSRCATSSTTAAKPARLLIIRRRRRTVRADGLGLASAARPRATGTF